MKTEWLASLIFPRAVAVHPNFTSEGIDSAPAWLAGQLLGGWTERTASAPDDSDYEYRIARGCRDAVRGDLSPDDSILLERSISDAALDPAIVVAIAVSLTAGALERGVHEPGWVEAALSRVEGVSRPEYQFCRAWLTLGMATMEVSNLEGRKDLFESVQRIVRGVDPREVPGFPTAGGLNLESATVVENMLDLIDHAAADSLVALAPFGDAGWASMVRRQRPSLLRSAFSKLHDGHREWTKESFFDQFRGPSITFGGSEVPGDDELVGALTSMQLAFHPYARSVATEIAQVRMLRSEHTSGDLKAMLCTSAFQLARYGRDEKTVLALARWLVKNGPNSAFRKVIAEIVESAVRNGWMSTLDLKCIVELSFVMRLGEARILSEQIVAELRGQQDAPFERWIARDMRFEALLSARASLSGSLGDAPSAIGDLLDVTPAENERADRALADAIAKLPPMTPAQEEHAPTWLERAAGFGHASSALADWAGLTVQDDPDDYIVAVRAIDRIIAGDRNVNDDLGRYVEQVARRLQGLIDSAHRGVQTLGGGPSPVNVAAAYALLAGAHELWAPVVGALTDPRVQRSEKVAALRRMSLSNELVPLDVKEELARKFSSLLASADDRFSVGPDPFPAAIAAAAALGLRPALELQELVFRLAGAGSASIRREGADVLAWFPKRNQPAWISQTALMLSHDVDPGVRATAARTLALRFDRDAIDADTIIARLNVMLDGQGSWLARMVLDNIDGDDFVDLRMELAARISAMTSHHDWRVRASAAARLET